VAAGPVQQFAWPGAAPGPHRPGVGRPSARNGGRLGLRLPDRRARRRHRPAIRNHTPEHVAVLDHELSILAATVSPLELSRLAERFRIQLDPDDAASRAKRLRRDQKLHLSPTFGGNWVLSATLDPEAGATVKAALDTFTPPPDPHAAGLTETAAYRRSQAITEICRQALDAGQGHTTGGEKPHIIVTVDDETLRTGIGSGTLADGTPIPTAAVRRLACDSKIIPVLYGTASQPLDIGRAQRTVPSWIRKAVILRDHHCRFPNCDRPAEWADCHHAVHWRDAGPTALDNLVLLCRYHHHLCHEGGWTITVHHDPNGTTDFTFHPPNLAGRPRGPALRPPGCEQAA
jgi:hypothetical protein